MAVYTVLDREEIEAFISPFGIGPLIDYEGVAAGIENTNYFLSTDQSDFPSELHTETTRHYVLTLFEATSVDELAFYVKLTTLLNLQGLPVPCPYQDADGIAIHSLHNKPAVLIPKLTGEHPLNPTPTQCQAIGHILATIHNACLEAKLDHQGSQDLNWIAGLGEQISPQLAPEDRELLEEVRRFQKLTQQHPDLPQTVIHGDLFRDNVLFEDDTPTGLIDFNSAGNDYLLFDLAVVINDWCSEDSGDLKPIHTDALLQAYQQIRPFTSNERLLWNDFLRIAAARFWISRLHTQLQPATSHRAGGLVEQKDPLPFKNILMQRIRKPQTLPEARS